MRVAAVIPVGGGREDNLEATLASLATQTQLPEGVVIVLDGIPAADPPPTDMPFRVVRIAIPKHEPGMEQPRNVGVRVVGQEFDVDHAWFVDSDVILDPRALEHLHLAHMAGEEDRILVAPYDWMPPGWREPMPDLRNDPRWQSFDMYGSEKVIREDLAAGLACFSGNLVWPIEQFKRVGGFWNELHHGRCEDGELGLRAVAMGVGISFVADARGWHLYHDINSELTLERNRRDVPMLNARHPWVEGAGIFVVEEDGKRFDVRCSNCGSQMNTAEWWAHAAECSGDLGISIHGGA